MNALAQVFMNASRHARGRRAAIFRNRFPWIGPETRILDVGSGHGANIARVLDGFGVTPANVYVADMSAAAVARAHERFGFTPVVLDESGPLPFDDLSFDLVFCSSVIEHVTIPKSEIWGATDDQRFNSRARAHQRQFAADLRRVARAYFVQTPNRLFPIESHTWLPLVGYLPRRLLVPTLRVTNRVWVKQTAPDWRLLRRDEMADLFPDAEIVAEKVCGLAKSWMAIRARGAVTALRAMQTGPSAARAAPGWRRAAAGRSAAQSRSAADGPAYAPASSDPGVYTPAGATRPVAAGDS